MFLGVDLTSLFLKYDFIFVKRKNVYQLCRSLFDLNILAGATRPHSLLMKIFIEMIQTVFNCKQAVSY